jgi:TatA/E family protein of Tat protein translocase
MFGHFPELVVVLVLALIFFGPEKLPEIAASAGKMVGELRAAMDSAMHPDTEIADDEFATYYYDSLERSEGEPVELEDLPDPADDVDYSNTGDEAFGYNGEGAHIGPEHDVIESADTPNVAQPTKPEARSASDSTELREEPESV